MPEDRLDLTLLPSELQHLEPEAKLELDQR
jgi:hypothetical protein